MVRQGAAGGQRKTFVVEVQEGLGTWLIRVPEIPGVQVRVEKRIDIQPAAQGLIESALKVPAHFFSLHLRFPG